MHRLLLGIAVLAAVSLFAVGCSSDDPGDEPDPDVGSDTSDAMDDVSMEDTTDTSDTADTSDASDTADTTDTSDASDTSDADVVDPCDPDPCVNGTCGDDGACTCEAGFEGDLCDMDIDDCADSPCLNGGTCMDEVDGFSCMCAMGYTGDTCESEVDSCDDDPCLNGATCTNMAGVGVYECACADGFWGANCDGACEQGNCAAGAVTCDQDTGENRMCSECVAGYAGTDCTEDFDACADMPCFADDVASATCEDLPAPDPGATCTCPEGYEGDGVNCVAIVRWSHIWGDDNDDRGVILDVVTDADGNTFAASSFGGDITVGPDSYTVDRNGSYVAMVDPDGTLLWSTGFGVPPTDVTFGDMRVDRLLIDSASGDVFAVGLGFGDDAQVGGTLYEDAMPGAGAGFVARLDADDGEPVWTTFIGAGAGPLLQAAVLDGDGNLVVGGYFSGTIDLGGGNVLTTAPSNNDSIVAFVDAGDGSVSGGFRLGGPTAYEQVSSLGVLPGGDLVIGGTYGDPFGSMVSGDFGGTELPTTHAEGCSFFGRMTTAGVAVDVLVLNTAGTQPLLQDLRVGTSGDWYVAGKYSGTMMIGGDSYTAVGPGIFVARIDGDTTTYEWAVASESLSTDAGIGLPRISLDANEDVVLAVNLSADGTTSLFGGADPLSSRSAESVSVIRLDGMNGARIGERVINVGTALPVLAVDASDDGRITFSGNLFRDGMLFGQPFEQLGDGEWDQYVIQLNFLD